MNLKARSLTTTAVASLLLLAACGGGSADSGDNNTANSNGNGTSTANSTSGGDSSACQPPADTTVVGGKLQVAQAGSVIATLVSSPSPFTQAFFDFVWATGLPVDVANHQIDAVSVSQPSGGAWSGMTVELRPADGAVVNGQRVTGGFPAGTAVVLRETMTHPFPTPPESVTTGNDLGTVVPRENPVARVTFQANHIAVVTLPSFGEGADYVVRLSNVTNFASPSGC